MKLDIDDLPAGTYTLTRTADGSSLERLQGRAIPAPTESDPWRCRLVWPHGCPPRENQWYFHDAKRDPARLRPPVNGSMKWFNSPSQPQHMAVGDLWEMDNGFLYYHDPKPEDHPHG